MLRSPQVERPKKKPRLIPRTTVTVDFSVTKLRERLADDTCRWVGKSLFLSESGLSENLENEGGHGKVMEKSWNMKNWPKVMEIL